MSVLFPRRARHEGSLLWLLLPLQILWPGSPGRVAGEAEDESHPHLYAADLGDELPAARPAEETQLGRDAAPRRAGESGSRAASDRERWVLLAVLVPPPRLPVRDPSVLHPRHSGNGLCTSSRPPAAGLPRGPPSLPG
jgi:hypothetical protein